MDGCTAIKSSPAKSRGLSGKEKNLLADSPLLQGLSPELQEELVRAGTVRTLRRGEFLFMDGDPVQSVYYLLFGKLQEYYCGEAGEMCLRRILQPGSYISLHLFFTEQQTYTYTCEAVTGARYFFWTSRDLQEILMREPCLGVKAAGILSGYVEKICRLNCLCRKPQAVSRVAGFLLRVSRRTPESSAESAPPLPVDLRPLGLTASTICLARETLSRALSSLQEKEVIRIKNSTVDILDLDALKRISGIL